MNYFEDTWVVLDNYFKSNPYFLTKHHLDSFNDFVFHKVFNTIRALNPILVIKNQDNNNITHEIEVYVGGMNAKEIFINKPTIVEGNEQRLMYPNEARLKDFTYQSELYSNIYVRYITREAGNENIIEKKFEGIKIGAIPIMLHSKLCLLHDMSLSMRREMGECKWDQGGYFIVDGKEKVIIAQERIATNRIFINRSKDPKFSFEGLIRCTSEENPLFPKLVMFYINKLKSLDDPTVAKEEDEQEAEAIQEQEVNKKDKRIHNSIIVEIPFCSQAIPLFVLFRALGIESDKEIIKHILYDDFHPKYLDFLTPSVIHGHKCKSQEEAIKYIANFVEYRTESMVKKILINDVFPNVGKTLRNKAIFLGHLVKKIINIALGINKEVDRDSYTHKRVDISGFLLGNLFRDYYNQFRNTIRNNIDNQYLYGPWRNSKNIENLVNPSNMRFIFNPDIIENGMKKSLKGNWGKSMLTGSTEHMKQGLVQDLSRISYLGSMSHLRRVNTPIDPTSKVVAPHQLHSTQWGIMCPCESPDGASIGLLKNFAILCHITFDIDIKTVIGHLDKLGLMRLNAVAIDDFEGKTKVMVNSNFIGLVVNTPEFLRTLKLLKRNNIIHPFTSISWNIISNEIHILTEAGRCCRPLYVIEGNKLLIENYISNLKEGKIGWNDFFKPRESVSYDIKELEKTMSPIEFVDVEETSNSLIAMTPADLNSQKQYSYCEIHPSTIFSVLTHNIPLSQHNQAPRNIFSGAQGKQAIGIYATNFNDRIDTMSYVLHYPQKSLVHTRYMEYMHNNDMPNGENLIVAIATYTGYNQEDSIIINRNSIQRGCFNLTYFKNKIEKEEEEKMGAVMEKIVFRNPQDMVKAEGKNLKSMKYGNFKHIDENGYPRVNTHIQENDVIFGKVAIHTELVEDPNDKLNIFNIKIKTESYDDKSVVADKTINSVVDKVFIYYDENDVKTCKIRFRKMRLPEPGDKLCSRAAQKGVIGMIIPQENMPFTKDGIVPDIIINPHAFPTRMTLGHLFECILAKTGCMMGTTIDGTPFNNYNYDDITNLLESKYNMDKTGNEILYNGFNGNQMECDIFMGPTYYERLKHMVADKVNYRSIGPITNKTRQPTQGRGNGGGLRIGEMERDSLLSHGAVSFLKESLMERSDIYEFKLDSETGLIANKDGPNVKTIKAPCSLRLLLQEIYSMGVKPILQFKEANNSDSDDDVEDAEVDRNFKGDDDIDNFYPEEIAGGEKFDII